MHNLEKLRGEIDQIDRELVRLFERRMDLCRNVARYKKEHSLPVFHAGREESILQNRISWLQDPQYAADTKELFAFLMSVSKREQFRIFDDFGLDRVISAGECDKILKKRPIIAIQGTQGSYAEQAAEGFFADGISQKTHFQLFGDVFSAVESGHSDYGVLPVENSSTGAVSDVLDLLNRHGCYVVGEYILKIEHCLLGVKGARISDIREVYSHEQGLMQCSSFLQAQRNFTLISYHNTAISAKYISEQQDQTKACIAGAQAAAYYGLDILAENIGNTDQNRTRFIVIAKRPVIHEGCNKISATFKIPHESGSLFHILSNFANNGLSLTKIESRPVLGSDFEYLFYVDFLGNIAEEGVKSALSCVIESAAYFKFLGNYPAAR